MQWKAAFWKDSLDNLFWSDNRGRGYISPRAVYRAARRRGLRVYDIRPLEEQLPASNDMQEHSGTSVTQPDHQGAQMKQQYRNEYNDAGSRGTTH
jgi:hypothetical protein